MKATNSIFTGPQGYPGGQTVSGQGRASHPVNQKANPHLSAAADTNSSNELIGGAHSRTWHLLSLRWVQIGNL